MIGTSAASLNPDLVTRLEWWLSEWFEERDRLQAAELVAFDALEPTLRSRGSITEEAEALAQNDEFTKEVRAMLEGEPTGTVEVPTLSEALSRIERLEEQVGRLQKRLREIEDES